MKITTSDGTVYELDSQETDRMLSGWAFTLKEDKDPDYSVRNSIAQAFSRRYLKGIANTEMMKEAEKEVRKIVKDTAENVLEKEFATRKTGVFSSIWEVAPTIKAEIRDVVKKAFDTEIREAFLLGMEAAKQEISTRIDIEFRKSLEKSLESSIKEKVAERLQIAARIVNSESLTFASDEKEKK